MARPSVPKFGDWGTNDQNFTSLFENARAEKGTQRVNQLSSSCYSSSFEEDSIDCSVELEKASSDRKLHGASPSPSLPLNRLPNRAEKGTRRVNPVSSSSTSSSERDGKASSLELGNSSFDRKSVGTSASASPRLNPFSNRAYNQRDYEYIASFTRPLNGGSTAHRYHGAHKDSDASTSSLSASFLGDSSVDSSGSRKQEYQQRINAQTRSDVPDSPGRVQLSEGCSESDGGSKENKRPSLSPLHNHAHQGRQNHEASVPSPARKMAGEAGAQGKCQGPRASTVPDQTPAALPKFGDWNPAESYTAIFEQHRKEKLTGQTLQPSPLQPQTAGRTKPAAPQRKQRPKWGLCCKDSAVED